MYREMEEPDENTCPTRLRRLFTRMVSMLSRCHRPSFKDKRSRITILSGLFLVVFVTALVGLFTVYVNTKEIAKGGDSNVTKDGVTKGLCISPSCVLRASIDTSVDPCTDFYQYACGNWMKTHNIPDDQEAVSAQEKVDEVVSQQMKHALEQSSTNDTKVVKLAKTFYRSCLDEEQRKRIGVQPLINLINRLGTWPLTSPTLLSSFTMDLEDMLVKLADQAIFPFFSIRPSKDPYNSSSYILTVGSGSASPFGADIRNSDINPNAEKTILNLKKFLRLLAVHVLGVPDTQLFLDEDIHDVLLFEAKLAGILRNDQDGGKKMTLFELQINPKFNWMRFLTAFLRPKNVTITESTVLMIFTTQTYLHDVMDLYDRTNKRTVGNFFLMKIVGTYLSYLPKDLVQLLEEEVFGTAESEPLWKECVQAVIKNIREGAGQLYVTNYFSPIAKTKALEVTRNVQAAMEQMIEEANWLDEVSKPKAIEKLKAMVVQVGNPDYQFDNTFLDKQYANIRVVSDNYLQTMINIREIASMEHYDLLDNKHKDVILWTSSAATVNAQYAIEDNAMRFLAAILQPPYFGEDFPKYMLFGSTGFVAGHEMTHGFDTKGSLFDKDGNAKDWWSKESREMFNILTQCYVDQYSDVIVAGLYVNGHQTCADNIADNGGLKAAYMALERWQRQHGREPQLPGLGLTNEQVFFLSMAQPWCEKATDAALKLAVQTDEHSPNSVRVRMTVANSPYFAEAFKCPAGSPMNPVRKCKLW